MWVKPSKCGSLSVLLVGALLSADPPAPPFKITTKRDDDKVEVRIEKDKTTFLIRSPFGISQMVIERAGPEWPKEVVLRLHLKGLENLKVSNSTTILEAAVSSQGKPVVRVWKDGDEDSLLDSKSPLWLDVRSFDGEGIPARSIPLKGGYFEVRLPKALFEKNQESITVSWIDFYRN